MQFICLKGRLKTGTYWTILITSDKGAIYLFTAYSITEPNVQHILKACIFYKNALFQLINSEEQLSEFH